MDDNETNFNLEPKIYISPNLFLPNDDLNLFPSIDSSDFHPLNFLPIHNSFVDSSFPTHNFPTDSSFPTHNFPTDSSFPTHNFSTDSSFHNICEICNVSFTKLTDFENHKNILVIICDGKVKGSESNKKTNEIKGQR